MPMGKLISRTVEPFGALDLSFWQAQRCLTDLLKTTLSSMEAAVVSCFQVVPSHQEHRPRSHPVKVPAEGFKGFARQAHPVPELARSPPANSAAASCSSGLGSSQGSLAVLGDSSILSLPPHTALDLLTPLGLQLQQLPKAGHLAELFRQSPDISLPLWWVQARSPSHLV